MSDAHFKRTEVSQQKRRQLLAYLQDRRGFDDFVRYGYLLVILGAIGVFFGRKIMGGSALILGILATKCLSEITRPPSKNPWKFLLAFSHVDKEKRKAPLLVCLGDSITHGQVSANWVDEILPSLAKEIKYPGTLCHQTLFQYPLYVVNAGQNSLTSRVIVRERIKPALECRPDYVVVMIGTNDVLGMYMDRYGRHLRQSFKLKEEEPSWDAFERNVGDILDGLLSSSSSSLETGENKEKTASSSSSSKRKVAICTLPPLGEDLTSDANRLVKHANTMIEKLAEARNKKKNKTVITVLPVFEKMQERLLQVQVHQQPPPTSSSSSSAATKGIAKRSPKQNNYFWKRPNVKVGFMVAAVIAPFRFILGFKWKQISKFMDYELLADAVHLNETGGEIITDLVVEWLLKEKVEKAIKEASASSSS
jgi:lysophospholipase L1-like esterase